MNMGVGVKVMLMEVGGERDRERDRDRENISFRLTGERLGDKWVRICQHEIKPKQDFISSPIVCVCVCV